jgi:hypothetical protein
MSGLSILIRTASVSDVNPDELSSCPTSIEETTLLSCGFRRFGGHRWTRIVGENQEGSLFIDLATVVGDSVYLLVGFPRSGEGFTRGGQEKDLARVEQILLRARIA